MANIIEITDDKFKSEVSESKIPVLVDFYAVWCGPCKAFSRVVEDIAKEYAGKLKVVKVNIDNCNATAAQFGIMSIPTAIFFKDGKELNRSIGALSKEALIDQIKGIL